MKNKNPKFIKPNAAEMSRRLDIVEELLLKGLSVREIRDYLGKMKIPVALSKKQISRYVTKINKLWDKSKEPHREREIKKGLMRYESLIAKSIMIQDYRTAAKIQDSICKLLGLNQPELLKEKNDSSQFDRFVDAIANRYKNVKEEIEEE